jgi:anti-anti-sigma factor
MASTWGLEKTNEGVSVYGEVDLATAGDFAERLYETATDGTGPFLIDLSQVTFIDSSGTQALTRVIEMCAGRDVVVQASRQVYTLLELVGLTKGMWESVVVLPPPEDGPTLD